MVSLNGGFNAADVEPAKAFEVLPQGDYLAIIESTEMKETKAKTGTYIEVVLQIVDGEHKGRKLWERLTWTNPSEKAVTIGRCCSRSATRSARTTAN